MKEREVRWSRDEKEMVGGRGDVNSVWYKC